MKLDLGCGNTPEQGYVGVDLPSEEPSPYVEFAPFVPSIDAEGIIRFDLASGVPWPFETGTIEGLFSSHAVEHLPACRIATYRWASTPLNPHQLAYHCHQDALFWFLDEAWRVTKAGGEFLLRWPALRNETTREICISAFQDPTHYRFIPLEQVPYWSHAGREGLGVSQYRARCNWVVARDPDGAPKLARQRALSSEGPDQIVENEILFVKEP